MELKSSPKMKDVGLDDFSPNCQIQPQNIFDPTNFGIKFTMDPKIFFNLEKSGTNICLRLNKFFYQQIVTAQIFLGPKILIVPNEINTFINWKK